MDEKITGDERYLVVLDPFIVFTLRAACEYLSVELEKNKNFIEEHVSDEVREAFPTTDMSNKQALESLHEFLLGTSNILAQCLRIEHMPDEDKQILNLDMMVSELFTKWLEIHKKKAH